MVTFRNLKHFFVCINGDLLMSRIARIATRFWSWLTKLLLTIQTYAREHYAGRDYRASHEHARDAFCLAASVPLLPRKGLMCLHIRAVAKLPGAHLWLLATVREPQPWGVSARLGMARGSFYRLRYSEPFHPRGCRELSLMPRA